MPAALALPLAASLLAADPRAYLGDESVPVDLSAKTASKVTLIHTAAAAEASAPEAAPRYYRAPLGDPQWARLVGRQALLVLGRSGRECVTLTRVERDAVHYQHRKYGPQQVPRGAVTAVHEGSWECAEGRESTPAEWARVGAAVGLSFSAVGLLMGALRDADAVPHFMYAGIGVPTSTLGTPIVAIGGASTSRDLRVRGRTWARGLGYALYAGSVLVNVLWFAGQYGEVESLQVRGLASLAGGLGLAGAGFMTVDALSSRAELRTLNEQDMTPRATARRRGLRLGAGVSGQGFSLGLGGRF